MQQAKQQGRALSFQNNAGSCATTSRSWRSGGAAAPAPFGRVDSAVLSAAL